MTINANDTNIRSVSPSLILPNELSYLPLAINFARDVAGVLGFQEKEIRNIEVAVEEAVSNVIRHAFSPDENAEFHIICESIPLGLKLKSEELGYTSFYFHGGLIPMLRLKASISSETLDYNRLNTQLYLTKVFYYLKGIS